MAPPPNAAEPLLILAGATASGKTRISLELARRLNAEIISLDSMLLYRGLDIGTAKPTDLGGVPHHLIDLLEPHEPFDLRRYLDLADAAIAEIVARGRRVLVVGGTGLYLRGLLKGVFAGPPRNEAFRAGVAGTDATELHARLSEVDAVTAAALHPNDRRRVTRALEVFHATGQSLAALQKQFAGPDRYPNRIAGLQLPRAVLRERVVARVDAMLAAGLVAEVQALGLGPTAAQAVGYKEIRGHLRGAYDLAEARRLVIRNTMRLARRQATWFRRFPIHWEDPRAADAIERVESYLRGTTTA